MKTTLVALFVLFTSLPYCQQHPLPVENASLLEPGHARLDLGASYFRNQPFPLSGLEGHLLKFGNLRFAIALSDYVELQTDGTLLNLLDVRRRDTTAFNAPMTTTTTPTGDIGDFSVWTKFGILNEYRSGVGLAVRFGIQLPNASNESGLGVDEMNFYSSLLLQKHVGGLITVNAGLGILSDPAVLGQQHDVFIYSAEYFLPVGSDVSVLYQTAGRIGHSGIGVHALATHKAGWEIQTNEFTFRTIGVMNRARSDRAYGIELTVAYQFHALNLR